MLHTRRTFLTGTAAAAVVTALPRAAGAMDPVKRAGPTRLRIGLAAYSMRQVPAGQARHAAARWICSASSTGRRRSTPTRSS